MFGNRVEVVNLSDHLDVKLFLTFRKLWLKDHEIVVSIFVLETHSLSKGRHLTRSQVDTSLNLASPITKQEHVRVILPSKILKPSHYRNRIKCLPIKSGIL